MSEHSHPYDPDERSRARCAPYPGYCPACQPQMYVFKAEHRGC